MAFDAAAALTRFKDSETTVVLWRNGWQNEKFAFDNIRDAALFAKQDVSGSVKIELLVHRGGHDIPIQGDHLTELMRVV